MNTKAIENFISLPYTSASGYFVFRNLWDILTEVFVLFFVNYFEEKRLRLAQGYTFVTVFVADMSQYQYVNVISTSTDNQSLIIVKCPLYNFVTRGVCVFQKVNTSVGNKIVGFNSPFKRKTPVCNIAM